MCGIVGAKLEGEAVSHVKTGLKRLEYRGYDSAGVASAEGEVELTTAVGTVDEVDHPEGASTAIGHTRWATHGGVNETNAHPHSDCENEVAVVHNGIVENHEQLKRRLEEDGHVFTSETDTEVIPHLIEEQLEAGNSLRQACEATKKQIEGSYAVAVMKADGEMAAFRKGSPLVVGVEEDGYHVSSDVTGFLDRTSRAIYLEDGDLAVFNGELRIFAGGAEVDREVRNIDWDVEQASKEGFDHFMQKEILEQSETIKRAGFQNRSDLEEAAELVKGAEKLYLTGCGTASYAAMMGAEYLRAAGVECEVEQAHEIEYRAEEIGEDDVVVAVSQSGETADLLSALRKTDASVVAAVNVAGSTLARNAEKALMINAGPEIGVASTKAFTAQMVVLKLLAAELSGELEQVRDSVMRTAEKVEMTVEQNEQAVSELSTKFAEKDDVYFIGRGKGRILAYEAALKLKELSYIHAEGFPGGEFKHGTLALVEDGVPVVAFTDHHRDEIMSNAVEARSRGAELTGCGSEPLDGFESFLEVPEDENREILEVLPFQMLAYRTAVELGHNPDKPRNLAKSVTVK